MQLVADLHTHTIASTHAFSTVEELAAKAKKLGYAALAITDHGPATPDAPHLWHFNCFAMPDVLENGVILLEGVEANVMDMDGALDLPRDKLEKQDWVIASMHRHCIPPMDREAATDLWLKIAKDPLVDMIGHCEQRDYEFDYDRVTRVFADAGKVVEMNAGSRISRPDDAENQWRLAESCKRNGVKIAVTSDAHSIYMMDKLGPVVEMLEEIGYPEELIVNTTMGRLVETLQSHGRAIARRIGDIV